MREAICGLTLEDGAAFVALVAFAVTTLTWGGYLSLTGI